MNDQQPSREFILLEDRLARMDANLVRIHRRIPGALTIAGGVMMGLFAFIGVCLVISMAVATAAIKSAASALDRAREELKQESSRRHQETTPPSQEPEPTAQPEPRP
ncbi:MAG: hypothetical protein IT435_15900 [Phycisphaerales bacterium]|nr:hypothetical protein [Phycisphaerales bacterium]